jgi:hypothetical protein
MEMGSGGRYKRNSKKIRVMSYRKSNFKIGQIHSGDPTKNKSQEAWLRNYLYGVGMLVVGGGSKESCKIRLVGSGPHSQTTEYPSSARTPINPFLLSGFIALAKKLSQGNK